ncbi:MAG: hypothetical protein ACRC3B_05400, partial [Bacteroidia bacterium]
ELLNKMKYEGHPPLWNILLKLFNIETVAGIKLIHIAISSFTIIVISFLSPFNRLIKIGIISSYIFCFEYTQLSRNYSLSILFIFLALHLYTNKKTAILPIAVCLGLSAVSHIYAGLISGILFIYINYQLVKTHSINRTIIISWLLFAIFCSIAIYFSWPQKDHFLYNYHSDSIFSINKTGSALSQPFKAFFHFPDITSGNWWNTNIFIAKSRFTGILLIIVSWLLPFFFFYQSKKILITYFTAAVGLSILFAITPMPLSLRHSGFFAVLFLACFWLIIAEQKQLEQVANYSFLQKAIAGIILIVQVSSAAITHIYDWEKPFSNGKATAMFFQSKGIKGNAVCVYPHYSGPSVSLYLNDSVFYAERNTYGTYCNWSANNFEISPEEMVKKCSELQIKTGKTIYIASSISLDQLTSNYKLNKIASFQNATVQAENYIIYMLKK